MTISINLLLGKVGFILHYIFFLYVKLIYTLYYTLIFLKFQILFLKKYKQFFNDKKVYKVYNFIQNIF